MDHKTIEEYLLSKPNAFLDYPFGEHIGVYKVPSGKELNDGPDGTTKQESKMFAIISEETVPLQISLKCDPILAEVLREKYETVLPGYHLSKKHWNTILLTGQVPLSELTGFIDHSYELVVAG
jgi:predicted DNA-binding protein (MmcQ/YjbR family)